MNLIVKMKILDIIVVGKLTKRVLYRVCVIINFVGKAGLKMKRHNNKCRRMIY